MSSSNSHECHLHRLTIDAPEPGLGVLVIDAEGGIVGRCSDEESRLELDLPQGLYIVRSLRNGSFAETVVRHDVDQTINARVPSVYSAATIPGAETTHEYYAYPAWEVSQSPTSPDLGWDGVTDAGLLLFARAPRREIHSGENLFAGLSLRAPDSRTLTAFDSGIKRDVDNTGWAAFSARLSQGLLILEDLGERPRQVPVPLLPGWQTQFFVMYRGRLLWEDMRLAMVAEHELASRQYRSPYDSNADDVRTAQDIDAGLLALQNETPSMALHLVDSFLSNKFQNPILGLLGAYLLLLQYRRANRENEPQVKPDANLICVVLDNLNALIPASADVAALRLLAKDWVAPLKLDPIMSVPLFRYGTEALLRAAASEPTLLLKGSLLDTVSEHLYGDTVWTTWKPITLPVSAEIAEIPAQGTDDVMTTITSETYSTEPSWVEWAVLDAVAAAERLGKEFAVDDLVRRLGVSPHVARTAMNTILLRLSSKQILTQAELGELRTLGGDVTRALARNLGVQFEESLMSLISGRVSDEEQSNKLTIQQIYSRLKNTLTVVASPESMKISADTMLADIISPKDKSAWTYVIRRLTRQFSDYNVVLSGKELDSAVTVRDLARMIVQRLKQ